MLSDEFGGCPADVVFPITNKNGPDSNDLFLRTEDIQQNKLAGNPSEEAKDKICDIKDGASTNNDVALGEQNGPAQL